MRYAVLGTGIVGRTVAARLADLGHDVVLGTRDPAATAARDEYADWQAGQPRVRLAAFAEAARDHVRKAGANVRVFNFCPGLVDVENTGADAEPRPGFVHVSNMARTLLYALSLDRNVVLEDINIYAR